MSHRLRRMTRSHAETMAHRADRNSPASSELHEKPPAEDNGGDGKQTGTASTPDFRVAIDFGTTFTAIAFVNYKKSSDVFTVKGFPGDKWRLPVGAQVPTTICYLGDDEVASTGEALKTEIPNNLYGYEIPRRLELPEKNPRRIACEKGVLVTRPKLLLDNSPHLRDLKKSLKDVVQRLKTERIIEQDEDVITHLLVCFLKHTKSRLERKEDLDDDSNVEFTLTVPVCWSAEAIHLMSICLKTAMMITRFGTDGDTEPHLFIVNEAEAAATHAITSRDGQALRKQCFVMLDCGGGTTDVGTYRTTHEHPLRLSEEVSTVRGAICGSSDLNARMRLFAIDNLKDETYLEDPRDGITIENIVDTEIMKDFEEDVKRTFDITGTDGFTFRIRGLRQNAENRRITHNHFDLSHDDLRSLFDESLRTIDRLMVEQIEAAQDRNIRVDKILLVGGFGDSPTLKSYLRDSLVHVNRRYNINIKLVAAAANTSAAGVAMGAIKRAEDKSNGPKRIPVLSIGLLWNTMFDDPGNTDEVREQAWERNPLSKEKVIKDTLKWVIKKGEGKLEAVHEFSFLSMFFFEQDASRWIADAELFASDVCVEDDFKRTHPKNFGKTCELGVLAFDVTHLRDRMQMHIPMDAGDGSKRYEVTLRISFKIIDRHVEFTAYWPADDENAEAIQGNLKSLDISSAFKPGTA